MTITLSVPEITKMKPKIIVFGVGGAGGNAVNNMIEAGLEGVEFVAANTDAQSLSMSKADRRIQLGASITQGLGAGAKPDIGQAAAEESLDDIVEQIVGSNMAFITAGLGGGTGTGAAPVIARIAREHDILTVGVVTKPFQFEGSNRMKIAERGLQELQQYVDTLIVIPNQNLFRVANEKTTFADAFSMADQVLHAGVRGVTDLMVIPGLINLDFADIRTVMSEMGKAMMGTGEAEGEKRSLEAAEAAISNPLLDDVSMKGARGVLINITGGPDLTLFEVDEAANRVRSEVDPDANIIVGSTCLDELAGKIRVSVVATGIEAEAVAYDDGEGRSEVHHIRQARDYGAPAKPAASVVTRFVAPNRASSAQAAPRMVVQPEEMEAESDVEPDPAPEMFEEQPAPVAQAAHERMVEPETMADPQPQSMPEAAPELSKASSAVHMMRRAAHAASGATPFVAPKPVNVPASKAPVGRADPFAEAALTNGGAAAANRAQRGPSLFERLTGSSRPAHPAKDVRPKTEPVLGAPTEPEPVRKAPVQPQVQPQPKLQPQPPLQPQVQAKAPQPAAPAERIVTPRRLEDQLEIPTFLRRQVN
jgi:cell division protein FtsZ